MIQFRLVTELKQTGFCSVLLEQTTVFSGLCTDGQDYCDADSQ